MRLDHLLSKETVQNSKNEILRNEFLFLILFNFEGPKEETQKRETVVKDGGLAQLGERLPCTQEVSGSIPLISTTFRGS